MRHSFVNGAVLLLGAVVLGLDLLQDVHYVQRMAPHGWTSRLLAETLSLAVRNTLLFVGLLAVIFGRSWGWALLGAAALWGSARRIIWFWAASAAFLPVQDESVSFMAAYSTVDLVFRLLCMALVVDLLRQGVFRGTSPDETRQDAIK